MAFDFELIASRTQSSLFCGSFFFLEKKEFAFFESITNFPTFLGYGVLEMIAFIMRKTWQERKYILSTSRSTNDVN